jgi:phosphoserine aminotransferase
MMAAIRDECAALNPNKRCCSKEIKQLLKLGEKKMDKSVFKTGEGVKIAFTGAVEKQNIVKMVENCTTGQCDCMCDETKAKTLYAAIDGSDFYSNPVAERYRSWMNVPFLLANEDLNGLFLEKAAERDLITLKGHRSVGGMRASIYNAMPQEGIDSLVGFMKDFEKENA